MDLVITAVQRGKATTTVTATMDMAKAETTMAIIVMVTMEIMVTAIVTKVPAMVNRLIGTREAVMVREAAIETQGMG